MKIKNVCIFGAGLLFVSLFTNVFVPNVARADDTEGKIVFLGAGAVGPDNDYEIYIMDADGANKTRLTTNTSDEYRVELTPDGTKIVFASYRNGESSIYIMNSDGTGETRIGTGTEEGETTISPDGTKILFTSYRNGISDIFTMNLDGSNEVQLTSGIDAFSPAWSPDGAKIAYGAEAGGTDQIFVMNADGTGQTQVTNTAGNSRGPTWSPDSSKLAYHSNSGGVDRIFIINVNGTGNTAITNSSANRRWPTWSPGGDKIAYNKHPDIYAINIDGTGETQLTDAVAAGAYGYFNGRWWAERTTGPDTDSDGIDSATESAAPNGGDANNDGQQDGSQQNVSSFVSPVTNSYVSIQSSCTSNSNINTSSEPGANGDIGFDYPAGLVGFTMTCGSPGTTASVVVYFYNPPADVVARKYNSVTKTYQAIGGADLQNVTIGGQAALRVAYSVTDGGVLDEDMAANGTIVDPIGLAQAAVGAPKTGALGIFDVWFR